MTDIETLRSALREEPAEEFSAPDIGAIMAKGRRIRRRRRLTTGAGGVAATVVTVLVIVGAVALREPARQPEVLPPAASAPSSSTASPVPPAPVATAPPYSELAPLGDVIPLGVKGDGDREMVLYAFAIDQPTQPGVEFGLKVGYRNADGTYDGLLATNEYKGSDRSFGFHATDGGERVQNTFIPVFGYFAGPAVRITSTVRGKPVEAKAVPWSVDPSVVIFWFDQAQVESSDVLTPLVAYDAKGQRLTK
ncbi:hypothetical protein [Amycolatopsis pittospori]|uniref:hypothetical protein n=1 Tax=Amycolatopsis pittospori TaxID=2749434 RepID=UPI0015F00045|nr:hypothetical protein [Amycolatopsis pittospori]